MALSFGIILALISAAFFAVNDIYMSMLSKQMSPLTGGFIRSFFVMLLITVPIGLISGFAIDPALLPRLILTCVIGAVAYYTFLKALSYENISLLVPIATAFSVVTIILSYIFLGERINLMQYISIAVIIIGGIIVSLDIGDLKKKKNMSLVKGLPYAILTFFLWGIFYFLLNDIMDIVGGFKGTFYVEGIIALLFLPFVDYKSLKKVDWGIIKIALISAAFGAVALVAYNISVTVEKLSLVSPIHSATPLFVAVLAWMILKERINNRQKIGIIVITLGLIGVSLF